MGNPLVEVQRFGQSIWYDNIHRSFIESGELGRLIQRDGLLGITSNPAIFEKAISGGSDYDPQLEGLVLRGEGSAQSLYEDLAIQDIQMAADALQGVYERTGGTDGYVSLEVSPYLANDTDGTLEEARRLFTTVDRANVMIKVPATEAGLPAIEELIAAGINVNVTLLFSVKAYERVAFAYVKGLEKLLRRGEKLRSVSSVASFFVSRIDTLIDDRLVALASKTEGKGDRAKIQSLMGRVAIANAKIAYASYLNLIEGERWKALERQGARPQRLLWASTSTKNPDYPKTMYVDELVGPETVNTVPADTFKAFRETGTAECRLTEDWDVNLSRALTTMSDLSEVGLSMESATDELLVEGVRKFTEPFDNLLESIELKRRKILGKRLSEQRYVSGGVGRGLEKTLQNWRTDGKVRRLWKKDASLWSGSDEGEWLGWLDIIDHERGQLKELAKITADVRKEKFQHILLIGMGGASLCAEVFARVFGILKGWPELLIVDSTVPSQVEEVANRIDVHKTFFVVSSKTGQTVECDSLTRYFFDRVRQTVGATEAGSRFLAITDPGSDLEIFAKSAKFRAILIAVPKIGGRYSALSHFGMVPAALMGLDSVEFLDRAALMVESCSNSVPPRANPGVMLGIILGTLALEGRNKLTLIVQDGLAPIGAWIEQLIAESTGKEGRGLIPVHGEDLGSPSHYGNDRVFVYIREAESPNDERDKDMDAIEKSNHPVVRITLSDKRDLAQEFFRWEIATVVAASILGVNPFDQPEVDAAKIRTRALIEDFELKGGLSDEVPVCSNSNLQIFTRMPEELVGKTGERRQNVTECLAAYLKMINPGDYFAVNAFVEMNFANMVLLQKIRHLVRDGTRVATTLGFGPRFLHSTGQLHKGGPNSGVFLYITADDPKDVQIPGRKYTLGLLKRFQAKVDVSVVVEKGRRVLRVHVGPDVIAGLSALHDNLALALEKESNPVLRSA